MADNTLTIRLEAINNASQKVQNVRKEIENIEKSTKKAEGGFDNLGLKMQTFGGKLNVLGQRLSLSLSIPLYMFGKQAVETSLEVEKAWTRFDKVFSGTEEQVQRLREEGTRLSSQFATDVTEVSDVMGEWNKAGIDNEEMLSALTQKALETSVLFDTDLSTAFDGAKAVMLGFGLSVEDTAQALADINLISDTTAASEVEVLKAMERAGGTARQYGYEIKDLAAATAVFQQNNIDGAISGNALKSMMVSTTKVSNVAKDAMLNVGINMSDTAFRTAGFTDKLKILAKRQGEIFSSGNKSKIADWNEALAAVFGKFQIARANILIEDLGKSIDDTADTVSTFDTALNSVADSTKSVSVWGDQLNAVMDSEAFKVQQAEINYKNMQATLGKELLPLKIKLLETLTGLIDKFNGLTPEMQQNIIKFGAFLVVIGPVLALLGNLITVFGFLTTAIGGSYTGISKLTKALPTFSKNVGTAVTGSTNLGTIMKGGLLAGVTAVTSYLVASAIVAFQDLNAQLDLSQTKIDNNKAALDRYQERVGTMSTEQYKAQLQNAIDKSREADDETQKLIDRYDGLTGALRAVGDQFTEWAKKAADAIDKVKKKLKGSDTKFSDIDFSKGGGSSLFNSGGIVYAANGHLAKGRDTIPAMLSPGEMVLNKTQQSHLFDMVSGRAAAPANNGVTVNINVGNMIATRGEQREFARKIKELLNESNLAFA